MLHEKHTVVLYTIAALARAQERDTGSEHEGEKSTLHAAVLPGNDCKESEKFAQILTKLADEPLAREGGEGCDILNARAPLRFAKSLLPCATSSRAGWPAGRSVGWARNKSGLLAWQARCVGCASSANKVQIESDVILLKFS